MKDLDKSLRVLTYHHTSIRNIGLYSSLALAALVYSRFHRGKTLIINIALIISSLLLTILSIVISQYLIEDIKTIYNKDKSMIPVIDKWLIIPNIMIYINAVILLSTLFVLFNQFS